MICHLVPTSTFWNESSIELIVVVMDTVGIYIVRMYRDGKASGDGRGQDEIDGNLKMNDGFSHTPK